jgi:hypothetical protein
MVLKIISTWIFRKKCITIWEDFGSIYYQNSLVDLLSYNFEPDPLNKLNLKKYSLGLKHTFLEEIFGRYFTLRYKKINKHSYNKNDINIIYIPCVNHHSILFYLKNLPENIYNFSKENNVKIILGYVREHPFGDEIKCINLFYEKFCLYDNIKSKNIKILINGYEQCNFFGDSKFYYHINIFDRLMRNLISRGKIKNKFSFLKTRKYKFSLLFGTPLGRIERVLIFTRLLKLGIISDCFFYTMICFDSDRVKNYILNNINLFEDKQFITDNIDIFLKNKIYNENGLPLKDQKSIYINGYDFKIPKQIVNSYINIVFETRCDVPSITEKIYKPIICGVPFVWFGSRNILKYLKSKGYKEYPFIDYSFDLPENYNSRMDLLIKEIVRLNELDLKKYVNMYKDISEHNKKNFFETTKDFNDFLFKIKEYF